MVPGDDAFQAAVEDIFGDLGHSIDLDQEMVRSGPRSRPGKSTSEGGGKSEKGIFTT